MNKFKKISYMWVFLGLIIIFFHPIMYYFYVGKVFPKDFSVVGDLARMTYSVDLIFNKYENINLKNQHIKNYQYDGKNIDFITIGDSFSEGAASGLNPYYQDYIASIYGVSVLNIKLFENNKNYIETIYSLLNSGQLKEMRVKYVLIESVQRRSLERFAISNIDTNIDDITDFTNQIINNQKNILNNNIDSNLVKASKVDGITWVEVLKKIFSKSNNGEVSVINNLNLNALLYNLKFKIKGYGLMSPHVYREKLNQDFFSTKISRDLLFYDEDLKYLKLETHQNIELLNENFNTLAIKLAEKNIKLVFMPVVDKYNLYRPYIESNIYKDSIFFEYLETLPKEYIFINTKAILSKELEKGIKDLYYADDTHWSFKAVEAIVGNKVFEDIFKN